MALIAPLITRVWESYPEGSSPNILTVRRSTRVASDLYVVALAATVCTVMTSPNFGAGAYRGCRLTPRVRRLFAPSAFVSLNVSWPWRLPSALYALCFILIQTRQASASPRQLFIAPALHSRWSPVGFSKRQQTFCIVNSSTTCAYTRLPRQSEQNSRVSVTDTFLLLRACSCKAGVDDLNGASIAVVLDDSVFAVGVEIILHLMYNCVCYWTIFWCAVWTTFWRATWTTLLCATRTTSVRHLEDVFRIVI